MRSIPVDTGQMVFMAAGSPRPKLKNRETGEVKVTADGVHVWQLKVMVQVGENDGDTLLMSFPAKQQPVVRLGTPLRVSGLVAFPWETNGRHGVAFSADSVVSAEPAGKETA